MELLMSDVRGVYLPKDFAEIYGEEFSYEGKSSGYTYDAALTDVLEGPEGEYYWEAWDAIVQSARSKRFPGMILYYNGDLFIGTPDEIAEISEIDL
jgi:hypothetical protein